MRPDDEELIERFQNGELYAFELIVQRYKEPLTNFIYYYLGNRLDAEDVVQETFIRLYKKKEMYRKVAKFSTWIYTIASNLAKTELRKRKRKRVLSLSKIGYEDKDFEIPDSLSQPDKIVENNMEMKFIKGEIDKLPARFKEVVILRDIEQLSYEEISDILKIPIGTVKSRVNRGRSRLQNKLRFLME
ncbi:sigma-70 family RNA polymerase sigma factor [bacterium]|nr:sigma-70 family RNA polymerase sigma factor [bacterium]